MTDDMNNTVISGTPRQNSMKMTQNILTIGISDRLPSASRMPSGKETTMPTIATTRVTSRPPHKGVSTGRKPNWPVRRMKARTGKTKSR